VDADRPGLQSRQYVHIINVGFSPWDMLSAVIGSGLRTTNWPARYPCYHHLQQITSSIVRRNRPAGFHPGRKCNGTNTAVLAYPPSGRTTLFIESLANPKRRSVGNTEARRRIE